jgi:hypothetical protein
MVCGMETWEVVRSDMILRRHPTVLDPLAPPRWHSEAMGACIQHDAEIVVHPDGTWSVA